MKLSMKNVHIYWDDSKIFISEQKNDVLEKIKKNIALIIHQKKLFLVKITDYEKRY